MARKASFVEKYYFAKGYADRLLDLDAEVPSSEVAEYYSEVCNVNIVTEYENGFAQAEKDKVNGIV